ncbi:MAG: tRNA(Met) cytidine acetyltransferase [Alteromonadaceae bacterium]|nr:tRNA(Met) cytidine acetyltransferase [Alteromonadaceae bacterium]
MHNHQSNLQDWLHQRRQGQSHRQLLVVAGSHAYCQQIINSLAEEFPSSVTTILGRALLNNNETLELKRYRDLLGSECELAIYDGFDALRPNALLALLGTVVSGGLMVLCCPPLSQWPTYQEQTTGHYLSFGESCLVSHLRGYVVAEFKRCKRVALCCEGDTPYLPLDSVDGTALEPDLPPSPFATSDQHRVFNHVAGALKNLRYTLITAHRGRGKSTLMGMLAGQSLLNNKPVLITSRHESAAEMVFKGLALICPAIQKITPQQYSYNGVLCRWVPIDHTSLKNLSDHLLIIDEAAALPIPQLKQLCGAASSVLLSTTMLGYEGSGRGFITRFLPWLNKQNALLNHYTLHSPVRWFDDDPLEQFWHSAFALNTTYMPLIEINQAPSPIANSQVTITSIDKRTLIDTYGEQILGLLMQAHYQTTADELIRLTDSPNQHTLIASYKEKIIGVLNYQLEGGDSLRPVANEIASGSRRVNGHLSAQALALLVADPHFAILNYWRINRIAIIPEYRRQGIGSQLIATLQNKAVEAGIDGITTSFGNTEMLTSFWQQQQFQPVKPGLKKDASSGEYSLLMLRAISENITDFSQLIRYRFHQELALHPANNAFRACDNASVTDTPSTLACNVRILDALIQKHRSIQHSKSAIAWLLRVVKAQPLAPGLQYHIDILNDYMTTLDNPEDFLGHYKLTGKRAAEAFVLEQLSSIYRDKHIVAVLAGKNTN